MFNVLNAVISKFNLHHWIYRACKYKYLSNTGCGSNPNN